MGRAFAELWLALVAAGMAGEAVLLVTDNADYVLGGWVVVMATWATWRWFKR